MERFNLDTWLQDKSRKVIDDDGFSVEIIKWDANEKCPVVYLNHNGIAYNVSVDGMYDADPNHGLFFADDKFTEFEKELRYWGEEDERAINDIIVAISMYANGEIPYTLPSQLLKKDVERLRTIKPNHWKPSEYDISLLENIARNIRNNVRPFCSEVSALEDLIKNIKTL